MSLEYFYSCEDIVAYANLSGIGTITNCRVESCKEKFCTDFNATAHVGCPTSTTGIN